MTAGKKEHFACYVVDILFWLFLIWVDLTSKAIAEANLKGEAPIQLIDGVLEFMYLENTGAAFSMLENAQWLFILIAFLAMILIGVILVKMPKTKHYIPMHILLILISAGATGNLVDRLTLHYVRDFIYISLIDFPVFNVADMYVTVSTILLVILVLFYYHDEDFAFLGFQTSHTK